jgi:outer membrane receptor protein involved in Fe transport
VARRTLPLMQAPMSHTRLILAIGAAAALFAGRPTALLAQAITTGAIGGQVTDPNGRPLDQVQIQVVNRSSGYSTGATTRDNGRYTVLGLAVGGQYAVTVRRIGFAQETRENVRVSLGQTTQVDFRLSQQAVTLSGVQVQAERSGAEFAPTRQGTETTVQDTLIARMPNLDRDFTSLVKLSPQVAQPQADAPSAGGAYNRLNNFTVDGANQNDRYNLGSSEGQPGGAAGGRILSIEAVKEFQVLMAPTDVRQGNFGGMLVNAVTKSGTNRYEGGGTVTYRNPKLAADTTFIRQSGLQVRQYSLFFGGPIIRDRLHFFVAPEWQTRASPASGAFLAPGATTAGTGTGSIAADSIREIVRIASLKFNPGSTGPVSNENPLLNLFGRIDWQLSPNHRAVFRQLVNRAEQDVFSRTTSTFNTGVGNQNSGFRLGSNGYARDNKNNSSAFQLFSNLPGGAYNELQIGYNTIRDIRAYPVNTPEISVAVVPANAAANQRTNPTAAVTFGTDQFSPNNDLRQKIFELNDNYTLNFGAHTATFGGRFEHMDIYNNFAQRLFGVYAFASIADFNASKPLNYSVGYSNGGPIPGEFRVQQYSVYGQDQWTATERLTITGGLRMDIPRFLDRPAENRVLRDSFPNTGIATSNVPKTRPLWSPRVGFNWNASGATRTQVRGNVGVYTALPPFILLGNAFQNTGLGLVTLNCSGQPSRSPSLNNNATPAFTTDINALPRSCLDSLGNQKPAPAVGAAGTSSINIIDPNFKYPQNFTTSVGFDRELPYRFTFSFDALYRKAINGLLVRDRNLRGPLTDNGVPRRDREGRVLYDPGTGATASRIIKSLGSPAVNFNEGLIEVSNQSKDYNYTLTPQVSRRFGDDLALTFAYTFMQSKDVQSLTSDRAISNFRNGRQYAGLESQLDLANSYFERPHRFLFYGTYTAPWKRWGATDLTFYYEAMSGTPYTLTANSADLNGDGTNSNDPIYIPRNATDVNEFRIGTITGSGAAATFTQDVAAAQAFNRFIDGQECLRKQRGRIMERNSCRSLWQNRLDMSVRQGLPERLLAGQNLALQLDIINAFNLIGRAVGKDHWGYIWLPVLAGNFPQQPVLGRVGTNAGYNVYSFDRTLPDRFFQPVANTSTNFYQMQLTVRYSF